MDYSIGPWPKDVAEISSKQHDFDEFAGDRRACIEELESSFRSVDHHVSARHSIQSCQFCSSFFGNLGNVAGFSPKDVLSTATIGSDRKEQLAEDYAHSPMAAVTENQRPYTFEWYSSQRTVYSDLHNRV